MKTFTLNRKPLSALCVCILCGISPAGCTETAQRPDSGHPTSGNRSAHAGDVQIQPDSGRPRPPFEFSADDEALLDEVQRAAFEFFRNETVGGAGFVRDRSSADTVSVAGVGYQLGALPIGVERGWISRDEAAVWAERMLRALLDEPSNRKGGLYYHFLNPDATPKRVGAELVVSTIDSAILFAGAIAAGMYFDGDVRALADEMIRTADWTFFVDEKAEDPNGRGFISLGWKPASDDDPTGPGSLLPYYWIDSGDEHRLATFLAVCAPDPAHRLDALVYYRLRRQLGWWPAEGAGDGHVVWFPYSGALFTAFFAHCWIDYARIGVDNPAAFGVEHRARVDWWENSRRLAHLHRDKAIANPRGLPTLGAGAWGLSACDGPEGYLVPGLFPEPVEMIGAVAGRDYSTYPGRDRWGDGTVPPYAAASCIVFEPGLAVESMRHTRGLVDADGRPVAWRGGEGYGFVDSYRLADGKAWAAEDTVAIDHGPMLILIENARTGLVWRLFMDSPVVRDGLNRLGLGG